MGLGHSAGPFWPNRAFRGNGTTLRGVTRPVRVCEKEETNSQQTKKILENLKILNEDIAGQLFGET